MFGVLKTQVKMSRSSLNSAMNRSALDEVQQLLSSSICDHDVECVKDLLGNGASVTDGFPPLLYVAVRETQKEIASILLTHGADVDAVGPSKVTALTLASQQGQVELVDLLVRNGATLEAPDEGDSPLCAAISGQHAEVVSYLISAGANINGKSGTTGHNLPLLRAAEYNNVAIVNLLLQANCVIRITGKARKTGLHVAAEEGHAAVVQRLLACGAPVDPVDSGGFTPLMRAASKGHAEVIRLLCVQGAALNVMTGPTEAPAPCMLAAHYGHARALQVLLGFGADVNLQTEPEEENLVHIVVKSCPHRAVVEGRRHPQKKSVPVNREIEIMDLLVQGGIDINAMAEDGRTPLHRCVSKGCPAQLEYLIKAGADTLTEDNDEHTPLWTACCGVCVPITQLLIQHCPLVVKHHVMLSECSHGSLMQNLGSRNHVSLMALLVEGGYLASWGEAERLRTLWQDSPDLALFVDENLLSPWPLERLCRRQIRLILGENLERKLYKIPIPQRIRDNILLKHIYVPKS